jgi:hypothetical protein
MPIAVQAVELPMFVDWIDFNTGLLSFDEISMLILHDDHEKV